MLDFSGLNYWAVLAAWFINMGLGSYWYSPAGFAKQWSRHTGVDLLKIPQQKASKIIGFVALSALVQAVTLAVIINSLQADSVAEGLIVGLFLWFGLTAATTVGVTLYSLKSWKFLWLNSSYFLIVMAVNCVILAVWR